jgi:hypothetical protein
MRRETGKAVKCYQQNSPLLHTVWDRLERRLAAYPKPLRALGAEFVRTLGKDPRRHYFAGPDAGPILHFPIWLAAGRSLPRLPDLLESTALCYFFVRIQDNVIDEPVTRGRAPLLLLADAFLADAMALATRFSPGPRFWLRARSAWQLFAAETEAERLQLASKKPYTRPAFRRHARKVALARIPLYAVLSRQKDDGASQIAKVDRLIDLMGEAYGLVNDVIGCARDLRSGAQTYLLATARDSAARRSSERGLSAQEALVAQPLLEDFLERAMRLHHKALPVGESLGIRNMALFTQERTLRIGWHLRQATTLRLAVALARNKLKQ